MFFQWLTRFGSSWLRPLFGIVVVFLLSFWIFSRNESNWQLYEKDPVTLEYKQSESREVFEIGYFGTLKSLEIATPTLSIITQYTYEDEQYHFKEDNNRWVIFLRILGWIFWPAFLLSVSGVLKRN